MIQFHVHILSLLICIFIVFFVQIEDATIEAFDSIVKRDNIIINFEGRDVDNLPNYIEKWRMLLWDEAFPNVFKIIGSFKKSDNFRNHKESSLAVKRVLYR